jgi:predicted nucleic acid-binding Zn ribbon protein
MTHPNPQPPNRFQPPAVGEMTAEERRRHKNLNLLGLGLVGAVVLVSIVLTALEAPIDPSFTAPVLSAMLIAAAGSFGQAFRLKRDAKRRG